MGRDGRAPSCSRARRRSLFRVDGRHRLLRRALLHVETIAIGGLEPRAFHFVTAREGLHLRPLGLLVTEVDRAQGAHTADRAGSRVWLVHQDHDTGVGDSGAAQMKGETNKNPGPHNLARAAGGDQFAVEELRP